MKTMVLFVSAFMMVSGLFANSVDVIAKTLYHEARGEGEVGLRAVATILHNRAIKANGKATAELCAKEAKRKMQFSCWNGKKDLSTGKGDSWMLCVKIAKEIELGKFQKVHGHTHYYAFKKCNPKWAKGRAGLVIGNHKFLTVKG